MVSASGPSQAGPSHTSLPPLEPAIPQQSSQIRPPPQGAAHHAQDDEVHDDAAEPEDSCLICLTSPIVDRSILPNCSHSLFCFRCILTWIQVSSASYKGKARRGSPTGAGGDEANERDKESEECSWGRCPLCNRGIGRYILHAVRRGRRGDVNWERWWLRRETHTGSYGREDEEVQRAARRSILEERRRRRLRQGNTASRNVSRDTTDRQADLDFARQITQRRQIYFHGRYAKVSRSTQEGAPPSRHGRADPTSLVSPSQHLGSNPTTGLGPPPSPSSIRAKPHLLSPALPSFLRRELLALPLWSSPTSSSSSSTSTPDPTSAGPSTATLTPSTALDVPFLTTYLLSLLQHLDVRSEGFVKLLGEVLGDGHWERRLAEHFSHELGVFLRLGARGSVKRFDKVVAYDVGGEVERETGEEGSSRGKRRRESSAPSPSLPLPTEGSNFEVSRHSRARGPPLSTEPEAEAHHEPPQPVPPPRRRSLSPPPSPTRSSSSSSSSSSPIAPAPQREEVIAKRAPLLQRLADATASQSAEQRERLLKEQLLLAAHARGRVPVREPESGSTSTNGAGVTTRQREEELKRSFLALAARRGGKEGKSC